MSGKKINGVLTYSKATVDIYFTEGEESCQYCPLLQTYSRNQCMRTGELIVDTRGRGMICPLKFEEESNGQLF